MVNGFDRRGRWGAFNVDEALWFPWVDLCLRQIQRHTTTSDYEVLVWDNSGLSKHRQLARRYPRVTIFASPLRHRPSHGPSLDRLVRHVRRGTEFVVTLDTDAFPVRDGWLENLTGRLSDDVWLAGIWRDEMVPRKPAFVHPSCLAIRTRTLRDLNLHFRKRTGADVAHGLTLAVEAAGLRISRLRRSNTRNAHFLMGGIYGDLVYHQGAGSRSAGFTVRADAQRNEAVRTALRDAAFRAVSDLVDVLAGDAAPATCPELVSFLAATRRRQQSHRSGEAQWADTLAVGG